MWGQRQSSLNLYRCDTHTHTHTHTHTRIQTHTHTQGLSPPNTHKHRNTHKCTHYKHGLRHVRCAYWPCCVSVMCCVCTCIHTQALEGRVKAGAPMEVALAEVMQVCEGVATHTHAHTHTHTERKSEGGRGEHTHQHTCTHSNTRGALMLACSLACSLASSQ